MLSPMRNNLSELTDRKSTRLNSSHSQNSYAVFCLKKNVVDPEPSRQLRPQRHLALLGRARAHVAEPVGDAMAVGVHADAGLVVPHRDDQVSGIEAHAVERERRVDVVGHAPSQVLDQIAGDPQYHERLSFFFNDPAAPEIYTLSLHDALPI